MALAKSTRLWLILGIDLVFFLIELVIGSAVGSLALVADSFHMLNDVLSVVVALRAVKLANQSSSKHYTYGWQRAETLGALINGVFLVALCVTIFLQALERFVEKPTIKHPELVLLVGSCGLVFNILGLFLFHQHSHGHGDEDEQPRYSDQAIAAEEGQTASIGPPTAEGHTAAVADQSGSVVDVLPQIATGAWPSGSPQRHSGLQFETPNPDQSPSQTGHSSLARRISKGSKRHRRKDSSVSRRATSVNEFTHPTEIRQSIIDQAKQSGLRSDSSESEGDMHNANGMNESSPLLAARDQKTPNGYHHHQRTEIQQDSWHAGHKHKTHQRGNGHSHGDMNIRGIFLHVMGDALGNLGVIASAIFIWRTNFSWKDYADPVISLFITIIILTSAIPLCKAASRILLQAVPTGISVDDIQDDIEDLEGVLSCHHVHVWGLSETKMVASLHVQVDCDIREGGSAGYMDVARRIRDCLHGYGIHNSTIQPEFMPHGDNTAPNGGGATGSNGGVGRLRGPSRQGSRAGSVRSGTRACLLECEEGCGEDQQCCVPSTGASDDENHAH